MITLAHDCLVFQLASGENVPFSSDMVSVELMGQTAQWFDPDFVTDAAKAVFHYFKFEKGRQTVTVGEFAEALEQVLQGFASADAPSPQPNSIPGVMDYDLTRLAHESGQAWELFFFPRLRQEVRQHVQSLRPCVKHLLGAERWGHRCRTLEEQIVSYLRQCLSAEARSGPCSLMVH
jgi:hypothetical protein